jgi:proliferating cell nuclear antigen
MLSLNLFDAKRWQDIMIAISTLLEEAEFFADLNGLKLRAMDATHTAMVDLELPTAFFDKYQCDKPTSMRFSVKRVNSLLDNINQNESLEVQYYEEDTKMVLFLRGEYEKVFTLLTLTSEPPVNIEPKVEFKSKAKLKTNVLKRVMSDSMKLGDEVEIKTEQNGITFIANGLLGNVKSIFHVGDKPLSELSVNEGSLACYNLELLGEIIKNTTALSDEVSLEYSTDQMAKLTVQLPQGKMSFYLSPRIEQE